MAECFVERKRTGIHVTMLYGTVGAMGYNLTLEEAGKLRDDLIECLNSENTQ
jgi:uncharacterized membrane protein YeaQ/YmgE (transglycosylase-associated protein family)